VARAADRDARNTPGDLFVDTSCIACDTCRRVAPGLFGGAAWEEAFATRQPASAAEWHRALMALVACPVSAIGTAEPGPREEKAAAARAFPELVAEAGATSVHQCGWASRRSYGAASWLVVRPDGNVLVDSPRWAPKLAERIRELGGVRFLFLTHRDDVADHERWAEALGCERVLHARDMSSGTASVERRVEGASPVSLAPDLLLVPVPGHTAGSMSLLVGDRWLFTGDHLWAGEDGRLEAGFDVCWYSWAEQARSMERLLALRFLAVFPGHGRPWFGSSVGETRAEVARVVESMRGGQAAASAH
jgi:glyoxylase-like metal-dependent hydrolase (beta-lactamase superfamily II)/ferredoxin